MRYSGGSQSRRSAAKRKDAGDDNDEPSEVIEDFAAGESNEPVISNVSAAFSAAADDDEAAVTDAAEGRESQLFTTNESVDERESAATYIQAAYRGMKTRREIKAIIDARAEESEITDNEARQSPAEAAAQENDGEEETARQREFDPENSDEPGRLDDGDQDVELRSSYVADERENDDEPVPDVDKVTGDGLKETADVEDTNQDELTNAVTTLQAGFRGMKTRQELRLLRNVGETDEIVNTEDQAYEEKPEKRGRCDCN